MVGQSFTKAIEKFKTDIGGWVVFGLVFMIISSLSGSIIPIAGGLLFLPAVLRETIKAIQENRSPELDQLWNFDNIGNDFMTMLFYALAQIGGMMLCCVGWPFTWIGFWYSAELAAEGRVSPQDAMKLSWMHAKSHLGATIGMAAAAMVLSMLGSSFMGLGLLLTTPVVILAYSFYWLQVRDEIYQEAAAAGINVAGSIQTPALLTAETDGHLDIDLSPEGEMKDWDARLND